MNITMKKNGGRRIHIDALKRRIAETGLSQNKFAAKAGVAYSSLRSWLDGAAQPSDQSMKLLCSALHCTKAALCYTADGKVPDGLSSPVPSNPVHAAINRIVMEAAFGIPYQWKDDKARETVIKACEVFKTVHSLLRPLREAGAIDPDFEPSSEWYNVFVQKVSENCHRLKNESGPTDLAGSVDLK